MPRFEDGKALLTEREVRVISTLWSMNRTLASGTDDQRRELTMIIARQLKVLDPRWGVKQASRTRPQSKDSLAYGDLVQDGAAFWNWDWQNGDSREVQVKAGDAGTYITDQWYVVVTPRDILGLAGEPQTGGGGTGDGGGTGSGDGQYGDQEFQEMRDEIKRLWADLDQAKLDRDVEAKRLDEEIRRLQNDREALRGRLEVLELKWKERPIPTGVQADLYGLRVNAKLTF